MFDEMAFGSVGAAPVERERLFREGPVAALQRIGLGVAWRLKPERIAGTPAIVGLHLKELLRPSTALPHPEATLRRVPEVAGIAHDLSVPTLVAAYSRGLFPLSHVLTPKWLSPPERCILFYPDYHISKRFRPHLRKGSFNVTFDRDFGRVIKFCADPRGRRLPLTWITPRIMRAYAALHDAGYAHSFEVWNKDGDLVGGGYGVAVGGCFTLNSMFCFEDNSSKVGFTTLNYHLARWGFAFTDNRQAAAYKLQLGFKVIPRAAFLAHLAEAVRQPTKRGRWEVEADGATVAAWMPQADARAAA